MTLYDKIMQDAKPPKPYKLGRMDYYTIYCVCTSVRKCVLAAVEGAERSKISHEAINTIAFCNSLMREFHVGHFHSGSDLAEEHMAFNEYEIEMMLTIMEGCYCCGDRLRCPYNKGRLRKGLSKEHNGRITRTLKKLRKYKEEINEHNSNEMSNLGS